MHRGAKHGLRHLLWIALPALCAAAVLVGLRWPGFAGTLYRLGVSTGKVRQGPVAELIRTEWDFGRVASGPILHAAFPVRNTGSQRLILREQSSSCECLSARRPEVIIQPGDTRPLVAQVSTEHLHGLLRLELNYATNDPVRPRLTLVLLADIRR